MPLSNFPFRHGLRRPHHTRLDQPIDAVVYVSVVFVLFAAIILLLVATSCRRFQPGTSHTDETTDQSASQPQQSIVRLKERGARVCTEMLPLANSV
ncbi:uncharacterized protein LOC144150240 [Haemaphysalis longicornis]